MFRGGPTLLSLQPAMLLDATSGMSHTFHMIQGAPGR